MMDVKDHQQVWTIGFLIRKHDQPVIKKFKRRKVFKDNIWAAGLAEIESLPSENTNINYLLCVIELVTKYAQVKPLKDKKRSNSCR